MSSLAILARRESGTAALPQWAVCPSTIHTSITSYTTHSLYALAQSHGLPLSPSACKPTLLGAQLSAPANTYKRSAVAQLRPSL